MRKIPLFVLMYLVCGEFTPLVVIALSGLVPRTLWIPKQVQRAREKAEERRRLAYESTSTSPLATSSGSSEKPSAGARGAEGEHAVRVGQILGAYPAWWDRLPAKPTWAIRRRVERRLHELELDDRAIERDGGAQGLEEEEVKLAAETRGLNVSGKTDGAVREELKGWLQARKKRPLTALILEGPSAWGTG